MSRIDEIRERLKLAKPDENGIVVYIDAKQQTKDIEFLLAEVARLEYFEEKCEQTEKMWRAEVALDYYKQIEQLQAKLVKQDEMLAECEELLEKVYGTVRTHGMQTYSSSAHEEADEIQETLSKLKQLRESEL